MVKRILLAVAIFETLAALGPISAATIVLPARTHVVLVPKRDFLASDVKVGHRFDLTTQDPIIAKGYVAIPDGARARAHVVSNRPALRIVFDWIQLRGRKIGLDGTPYEVRARGSDGKRHRYFFGLLRAPAAVRPKLAREFPLEAVTARNVRLVTNVRASKAQQKTALRNLVE